MFAKFARLSALAIAFVAPCAPAAHCEQLDGKGLRELLSGHTVNLSAPFGSLPIRYSSGGTMVARSRAMGLFAGVSEDSGTWRISGNQFCQRWTVWNNGREQCFTVNRSGDTLHWASNDGMTGTAN